MYLNVKPGAERAARRWAEDRIGTRGTLLDRAAALEAGLWGPPPFGEAALRRIGTHLLLPAPGWHSPYRVASDEPKRSMPDRGARQFDMG